MSQNTTICLFLVAMALIGLSLALFRREKPIQAKAVRSLPPVVSPGGLTSDVMGINDNGTPVKITPSDPYIAPKTFEVGLMKTECRTADACHNALVSSPATENKSAVCQPEALYPITGLSPGYSTPCECIFTQFIRSP